ncbi:MAG: CoB--CoM heterodisulfide reductase iron-sulfur subunit A family protein [Firmicutes bacterium]|nr:CoB--CoM heterodisulfide reductase iron-sulfur subunit A family protein [Bacillota bacterium]
MKRVGVFVCHCGSNIAATVDVRRVAEESRKTIPDVVFSTDYKYMCSEPGQEVVRKAIREHNLDRVVICACSPRMHEATFRKTAETAGLNPFLVEMANVREHCSWVHSDREKATGKAMDLARTAVAKAARNQPLTRSFIPVTKRALVIGGGIAGIQAALDIADAGYEVVLVEKEQTIGGKMAQLDKTFPTLDCSSCILTPKMVDAASHPNIKLCTYSEVEKVDGYIGNFEATIRRKARSVDHTRCTGCGDCWAKCPIKVDSEFDVGLGRRKAIYVAFPQAVPNKPVIDRSHCTWFVRGKGKCGLCQKVCQAKAVDFDLEDELITERFGAVVVATGYDLWDSSAYGEYGGGRYADVVSGLHLERLVSSSGPTEGKIKRPSDGKIPKSVVFIQCAGSRDENKGVAYCSKTCCMYTAKHAMLIREKIPDSKVYIFYIDIRTAGKGYEEFYKRAQVEAGATYIRGRVSKIYPKGEVLVVQGEDTLAGLQVEVEADMVVLATAMVARTNAVQLAQTIGFSYDENRFYTEAHPKLRPVETNTTGVFLAGACQGPKDIPETVAQAGAAAGKVAALFSKDEMATDPMTVEVNEALCAGCLLCKPVCPYGAIDVKTIAERVMGKTLERAVATVNQGLCQGCGACASQCPSGAMNLKGFTNEQILAEVEALCL